MKIIFPVAGKGTRLKPFTLHLPKCLLPVGGKTILDWIVESTRSLDVSERIFITGYKAECVEKHLHKQNWGKTQTVLQSNPQGLGEAISLCLPYLNGDEPLLIILGDTLFEADLSVLKNEYDNNVLMTLRVEDPRRFGVAVTDSTGHVTKLVEKPQEYISDEALIGIYYIKDVAALRVALQTLLCDNIRTRGEYQLTDALQMMIEAGCPFRTQTVQKWLDCGLPETLLETNAAVLPQNDNSQHQQYPGTEITPPCYIGKNVKITDSKIGPYVSIGDDCVLVNSSVVNSILWDDVDIHTCDLIDSVIGEGCSVTKRDKSVMLGNACEV